MRALSIVACAAILGGCAIVVAPGGDGDFQVATPSSGVEGNGVTARETRPVGAVQGIDVSGAVVVDVRVGPAPSLQVEADGNLLPLVHTDVRGDTLVVAVERSYHTRNPIRITYTTPRLTDLRQSGSGRLTVLDLNGAPLSVRRSGSGTLVLAGRVAGLDMDATGSGTTDADGLQSAGARVAMTGSGRVNVGEVRGDTAVVSLDGSGQLRACGAVRSLRARSTGSGHLDLAALASRQGDLASTGSGGITATVRESLSAQNDGSGGIRVYGNPAQRNVSGKYVQLLN